MTPEITTRICQWNADRYAQVYSNDLTQQLILEELRELVVAARGPEDNLANLVKEAGDLYFVVVGAMWKLGKNYSVPETISSGVFKHDPVEIVEFAVSRSTSSPLHSLVNIAGACLSYLKTLEFTTYDIEVILDCVCISNESKTILRAEPNQKYGGKVKGDNYVEAEILIQQRLKL